LYCLERDKKAGKKRGSINKEDQVPLINKDTIKIAIKKRECF